MSEARISPRAGQEADELRGDEALCPMHRSLPMTQAACLDETGNLSSKSCGLGLGLGSTWRGFESGFEGELGEQRSCPLRPWVRVRGGTEDPQRRAPGVSAAGSAAAAKLFQLCPTLCDPIDDSLPGSPSWICMVV